MTSTSVRTDESIHHDVIEEFKWDARLQPNEIGVIVKDGVVTLTGWVDSYTKKWAAEDAAHRVKGVKAVANDIEVRLPSTSERTDADIAAAVTRAIEWDALVPIEKLEITVAHGWVTMRGEVEWEFQRTEAERVARRITGVRGVSNLISVKPTVHLSANDLKERIEEALVRNAELDAQRIQVQIDGGKVTLRGTVKSFAEKQEAERIAWSMPGVSSVDNRINISL